ncbi:MAG: hypothetical protein KA444_07225 [Bacteroidia bacterium]|nr:hypothetical protein [Bacteroidia bacterium]
MMLFCISLPAQELSLDQIRSGFSQAVQEERSCTDLHSCLIKSFDTANAVLMAYHGTVTVTMAKYTSNPFLKYQYFTDGKSLLERSVMKDPKNLEIRFLRLTVQEHTPGFLGYNEQIPDDKKYILEHLENLNLPQLKKAIINYISVSNYFSETEKKWAANLKSS